MRNEVWHMGKAFSEEERIQVQQKLRKIGLRLFADKGIKGVSIREVTKAAEIAQGGFYTFYKDKTDFLIDLMGRNVVKAFVNSSPIIDTLRMIKDEDEIHSLIKACNITDDCFKYILSYIKPGMTEKQIAKEIDDYYIERTDGISFDTIVASGENSSKPHAVPTDRKIQEKDIITIDMGCKVNGYCSDMTRTFFVGEPTEEMKKVYDLVLNNQKFALEQYKEGASTRQLTKMVENDFKLNRYDLIHSLGHGVGLEIHEPPYIGYRNDCMLRENMVVTDEPGIYIPGKFGVRIEDTVQITKFGCISLTNSDKGYVII